MNAEDWSRVQSLFIAALELPSAARAAFLERHAAGDHLLREEAEALLAAHDRAGGTLSDAEPGGAGAAPAGDPDATGTAATATGEAAGAGPLSGRRLGSYLLLERIGRGGMGEVYRAERADAQFRQQVAVKVIRSNLPGEEMARRFRLERQVLARLQHPAIATLLDGGVADGDLPYLVMQYVDGVPVTEYADRRRLPVAERLRLFIAVCEAVHYAHVNLVVHRDLKPSNILVDTTGRIQLLDFGIAKLLDPEGMGVTAPLTEGYLLLTPEHAAPEQLQGGTITTATDVYALGVLLFELLAGRRPFRATGGVGELLDSVERGPSRPSDAAAGLDAAAATGEPGGLTAAGGTAEAVAAARSTRPAALRQMLRGDLDHIVLKALRREPGERYASAEQFAADVQRALDGRPVLARRDTHGYRARRFVRRHRVPLAAAAAVLMVLVGAVGVTARQASERAVALAQAELERDRYRAAHQRALLENTRAQQLTTLLMGLFERGGAHTPADSVAMTRLLDRGLARAESLHRDPPQQARMLTALGRIHRFLGDYPKAEAVLERSIELQRGAGRDPPGISEAMIALADVRWLTGRTPEADSLLRRALELDSVQVGDDHPRVAWALTQLGLIGIERGDHASAEPMLRRALEMRQRLAVGDDADVATAMLDVALLLRRRGEYRGAESLTRQALEIRHRLLSPRSWQAAEARLGLGNLLIEMKRPAEAEPLLREALEVYREIYGERHLSVSAAETSLGRALSETGQAAEAERLFGRALAVRRELFGTKHTRIVATLLPLGTHHLRTGRASDAESAFAEALRMQRELGLAEHASTGFALYGLGQVHARRGELDAAEAALREALAVQSAALGDRHPAVAETALELGVLLHGRGDAAAAEPLLLGAFATQQAMFGPGAAATAPSAAAVAALYESWGRAPPAPATDDGLTGSDAPPRRVSSTTPDRP